VQALQTGIVADDTVAICDVEVVAEESCPADKAHLVVPPGSEVVQRRNYILELMKVRSVLSGSRHTAAEYDAAIKEPVELVPQTTQPWKAAQFVWQVQKQLGEIVCGPESADSCEAVAVGGYQVVTTLDWTTQQTVEKWLYVSARAPQSKNTDAILAQYKIPKSDYGWIRALKGRNIQNAASAIMDARTAQTVDACRAGDLLLGRDEWGTAWISAYRKAEGAAAS